MRAIWCVAVRVFVTCVVACGGVKNRDSAPTGEGAARSRSAASLTNATTDFAALQAWCEEAYEQDQSESEANPVRGRELRAEHEKQLKAALEGKRFTWVMPVTDIREYPSPAVWLAAYHNRRLEAKQQHKTVYVDRLYLSVQFRPQGDFRGFDFAANPMYSIGDVPAEVFRALSKGKSVEVVGEVESASVPGSGAYFVRTKGAHITPPR